MFGFVVNSNYVLFMDVVCNDNNKTTNEIY